MKKTAKKVKMVVLPGCEDCRKVCQWRGATADENRIDMRGKYRCNSSK